MPAGSPVYASDCTGIQKSWGMGQRSTLVTDSSWFIPSALLMAGHPNNCVEHPSSIPIIDALDQRQAGGWLSKDPGPFKSYHTSQRITNIEVCLFMALVAPTVLGTSTTEFSSVFHESIKYKQYKKSACVCVCVLMCAYLCACGCTQRSEDGTGSSGAGVT